MKFILLPVLLMGVHSFRGEVVPVYRQTVDVVDTRAAGAAERIQALQREGSQCQAAPMGQVRCSKILPASAVAASSMDRVRAVRAGAAVSFLERTGDPVLVRQSQSGSEWMIPQRGSWSGGEFSQFRYMISSDGAVKMEIPGRDASAPLWLTLGADGGLRHGETVPTSEGRFRMHLDAMEMILRRSPGFVQ